MPIVQITILPQTAEKKAELSKAITDEIHRITGIPDVDKPQPNRENI